MDTASAVVWKPKDFFYLLLYGVVLTLAAISLPKTIWAYYETRTLLVGFGALGFWRYGWWSIHVVRSVIYNRFVFPRLRQKVEMVWQAGWRPQQLFFMVTTFKELKSTTEKVLQSIIDECTDIGVPGKIFIGTGCEYDEKVIEHFFHQCQSALPFQVVMVREKQPGKRYAISAALESMIRHGLQQDDPVVFMDGDTYFQPGCLRKCLPFFKRYRKLQALTTHEEGEVINGPNWMRRWLEMRFAQRHLTMQSHSLSKRLLTLTGRMSIFRGKHLLEPGFIDIIENDHLTHWLWGRYRFLSGDDKSTCYYFLKARAEILYIPDATTVTIENILGSPVTRMIENLKRWCGNTLRNGARSIALGPRTLGVFIWWCLIDQRLAVWTMFIGHMVALLLAMAKSWAFLWVTFIWIAFSRLCTSFVLFFYARRVDFTYPILIYVNQLVITIVKIYTLFRLPQQRWLNRGDQRAGFNLAARGGTQQWVANYLTLFYCACIVLGILLYLGIISMVSIADIAALLG